VGVEDFEGVRRTAWPIEALGKRAHMVRGAQRDRADSKPVTAYRYNMSMITYGVEEKGVRGRKNWKLETRKNSEGKRWETRVKFTKPRREG